MNPLRRPEEILAYRSLQQILAAKPRDLWTVGPRDNVLTALRLMAEKNIGFVVVMEAAAIVGALSERDCVRRLVLAGKSPEATPVADIMVRDVIKADLAHTFADCLKLMHTHGIRHLPVAAAKATNIPLEVLHRIAAMASGGMDTLPHNGAVITLLAVTGSRPQTGL